MRITTVNDFGAGGIFPSRRVTIGDAEIQTPTAANQVGKLLEHEDLHQESRGINELYTTVGGDDLDDAMRKADGGSLHENLRRDFDKTAADELTVAVTKYDETSTLPEAHAASYVRALDPYTDLLPVPMMSKLVGSVDTDEGLANPAYQSLKRSISRFLQSANEHCPQTPVMGLIPRLGWEYIEDLLELYEKHGVRAYAFDFDRHKVTAATQVAMVQPLMRNIAARGLEEQVLFYALNPASGRVDQNLGLRPAADMAAVGLGFDVIGGQHVRPKLPEEAFEQMESEEENSDPEFRLFDREGWIYRDIPLSELEGEFPSKSGFSPQEVIEASRSSPNNGRYRLQNLVNSEQRALAARDLQTLLADDDSSSVIHRKIGVTGDIQSVYEETRNEFDDERFQSGLGEFSS